MNAPEPVDVRYINKQTYLLSMGTQTITITTEEYTTLKKKAKIADDAIVQLKLSLEDLRHGRFSKF